MISTGKKPILEASHCMGKTSFIEMSTGKTNYRDELLDKTRCTSEIGSQIILHQVSDASKATHNANFGATRRDIIRHRTTHIAVTHPTFKFLIL